MMGTLGLVDRQSVTEVNFANLPGGEGEFAALLILVVRLGGAVWAHNGGLAVARKRFGWNRQSPTLAPSDTWDLPLLDGPSTKFQ